MESVGHKGDLQITYNDNGTDRELAYYMAGNYDGYNDAGIALWTPNRSRKYSLDLRSFDDHQLVTIDAPYYPVDGSGNPQPIANNALMASGNIAVDPRIVHTTGNEAIAGSKTFQDGINIGKSFLITNKTFIAYDCQTNFRRGVWEWYDKKDGVDSMIASDTVSGQYGQGYNMREFKVYNLDRSTAYGLAILAYADHCALLTNPYYPVDGSGNPQALTANALMASGNIAVDPRIVHTTGNETVAGIKQGDFRGRTWPAPAPTTAGKWLRYADLGDSGSVPLIQMVSQTANNGIAYGLAFVGGGGTYARFVGIINKCFIGYMTKVVAVKDPTTNHNEIWIYVGTVNETKALELSVLRPYASYPPSVTFPQTEHDALPEGARTEQILGVQ